MSLIIRKIEESDYKDVENLTREAFWNVYRPGCYEHLIIHNIHKDEKSIKDLEIVALYNHKIVGHIAYTKGKIENINNESFLTLGPVSIMPEFQGIQIGSKIIRISLQKAYRLGYTAVFIVGDENYYSRFGFELASKYNIYVKGIEEENRQMPFMVKILQEGALDNIKGNYIFDESYNVNNCDVEEFDKKFEYKTR